MGLTPKQKRILDFITQYGRENGYAPSQKEIADHFGFSSLGTVQNYLVRLQSQGFLEKSWNAKRSIEVVNEKNELPLLGKVAAGRPIENFSYDEKIDVPVSFIKSSGDYFALRVEGDSMIEDGILDGDFVVVRKQSTANNGQTVVAMIDNGATIKRFQKKHNSIELHPANPAYKPIVVKANQDFRIEGVLSGLIRRA